MKDLKRGNSMLRLLGVAALLASGAPLATPLTVHAESMAGDLAAGTSTFGRACSNSAITSPEADCIVVITITTTPYVNTQNIECAFTPDPLCKANAPSNAQWWTVDIGEDRYSGCKGGGYSGNPNGCSTHDYHVEQKSQDWWTTNAAGNNWVDGSNCVGYGPWACTQYADGSFWDQSKGASTDWSNWTLQVNFTGYHDQNNEYGRFWLYPGGHYEVYVGS